MIAPTLLNIEGNKVENKQTKEEKEHEFKMSKNKRNSSKKMKENLNVLISLDSEGKLKEDNKMKKILKRNLKSKIPFHVTTT